MSTSNLRPALRTRPRQREVRVNFLNQPEVVACTNRSAYITQPVSAGFLRDAFRDAAAIVAKRRADEERRRAAEEALRARYAND